MHYATKRCALLTMPLYFTKKEMSILFLVSSFLIPEIFPGSTKKSSGLYSVVVVIF